MRLSLTNTDSVDALGRLGLNNSGQLTSGSADGRAAETSAPAPVLWDGPEGRARRFAGFCSTFWVILYIESITNDNATLLGHRYTVEVSVAGLRL